VRSDGVGKPTEEKNAIILSNAIIDVLTTLVLFLSYIFLLKFAMTLVVPLLDITMVHTQNNTAGSDPIAAAIAAAAEIARNGGFFPSEAYSNKSVAMRVPSPNNYSSRISHTSQEDSCDDEDDYSKSDDVSEEDAERRMARSRERNREHARRTRLRKKAQLGALQSKVTCLQAESKVLKQSLEECSIASILVGLSSGSRDGIIQSLLKETSNNVETDSDENIQALAGGKRKRFACDGNERVPQPLKITIDGKTTIIGGGRTHINWKTGVYSDEKGSQRQLTQSQLESLR
jgi:hypothetical protein